MLRCHPSAAGPACSAPLLASALQRHLHWTHKSPVYQWWHRLDERVLRPLFGGRAPQVGRGRWVGAQPTCGPEP